MTPLNEVVAVGEPVYSIRSVGGHTRGDDRG